MQPTRKPRYTIGQLMVGIAVLASLLAVPRLLHSPDRLVVVCLGGVLTTLVLLNGLIEIVVGIPCPACSCRTLRRLARHQHYYRCSACRARFKRFRSGPWLDASGPDDATRYRKPSEAGTWKGFAVPKKLDGSSSGRLLGSKRSRDLPLEIKRYSRQPSGEQRLREAERKVRKFLKNLYDTEE
jgi:hypothetical protein